LQKRVDTDEKPRSRRKAALRALMLTLALVGVIAHTAYWHASGEHADLFQSRDARTVLYNLGLILATGFLLGTLMMRLTEALGYNVSEIKHFSDEEADKEILEP